MIRWFQASGFMCLLVPGPGAAISSDSDLTLIKVCLHLQRFSLKLQQRRLQSRCQTCVIVVCLQPICITEINVWCFAKCKLQSFAWCLKDKRVLRMGENTRSHNACWPTSENNHTLPPSSELCRCIKTVRRQSETPPNAIQLNRFLLLLSTSALSAGRE